MKKFAVIVAVLLMLVGCGSKNKDPQGELRVFSVGEYIDKSLITKFEKENNVRVIYDEFDSNEAMYTKLSDGSKYDILVPSDYMIQRLREEDRLQKVDLAQVPNYEYILPSLKNRHFDPNNEYAVPYLWGNVGILYNTQKVDPKDVESQGWEVLRNEKYSGKLFFYDSERDAFMIALKALGYSMNTTDEKELEEAAEWLTVQLKTMAPIYVTDEVIDGMASNVKDLAVMYSGDANYVLTQNPDMAYYAPEQGTNSWVDAMVIPTNAPNPELAHKWMNFVLEYDNALAITDAVGYTSPLEDVIKEVTAEGGSFHGVSSYVAREGFEKDEEFFYDNKMKEVLSSHWQRIKAMN